jgi:eukaryotic-like serine/threonine-protein kinase
VSKSMPGAPPVLAGYSYVRPLGVGGFADVFLFEQNMPRRSVAVKVLLKSVVDDDVIRMFNAEADVMARLSAHPSILTVYDASVSADGRPYIVMEYCPDSYSTRFRKESIPVAEVLNLGVKIASALETAHRSGLLHRDIKPSNLLVNGFGTPVLADFGIATSVASSTAANSGDQLFAMSIPWSAPEVVEKRITGSVTSEVWGLGSTLYTLLAGRSPFEVDGTGRNGSEMLASRISRAKYTPIARPDVPQSLQQVLTRAMQRDPRQRQQSMEELAKELQYVQYELGLMPTALEVAGDGWNTASTEVNFNNTVVRGPVISTVPHESKRVKATGSSGPRAIDDDVTFADDLDRPVKRSGAALGLIIGASVVGLLAVGAIVAAVVIGSMQ